MPIDYTTTIIYKLMHKEDINNANIYIGSTIDIINRNYTHKSACCRCKSKKYNQKKYQYIRQNGGWANWRLVEIEKYPCNNKIEAQIREEYWRRFFDAKLNTIKAHTTIEERNLRERYLKKLRYEKNKFKILEKLSQRVPCKCGAYVPKYNLSSHRKTKKHLQNLNNVA